MPAPKRLAEATRANGSPRRITDRPLQERAVRTRDNLLRSAAGVFERVGYSGATLEEIVSNANATKGALYFHFRSKAELAEAVLDAQREGWARIQDAAPTWGLNGLDTLGRMITEVARSYHNDPISRAGVRLGNERDQIQGDSSTPFVGWIDRLTKILRSGQRDGSVAADVNCAAAARVVVASFYGVQEVSARLTDRKDLMKRVDEWWTMVRPSLAA